MELAFIDTSRVIHLTAVHRPEGQIYQPELMRGVVNRYSFVKYPSLEELLRREIKFEIGKFSDAQIQEFSIYGDGLIASSASDTDIIEAFVTDILEWIKEQFGITPAINAKPETYFESTLIVKAETDLVAAMTPKADALSVIGRACRLAPSPDSPYVPSGFIFDTDAQEFKGGRKPKYFAVERRLGAPYGENVFYCTAPLRTKDHLAVLRSLEEIAGR
jgi:hypothetical protein